MRLRKAVAGEAEQLRRRPAAAIAGSTPRAFGRAVAEIAPRCAPSPLGALAGHRPPERVGLAGGEAGQRHRHLEHLLLVEDDAERFRQHRLEQGMVVDGLIGEDLARSLARAGRRGYRAADDRARADDRDLDDQVVQVARPGARQHLDLGAAFDLEDADRVAGADHVVDGLVVEIDPAEIDLVIARCSAISSRHSSTSESIPSARKSILTKRASSQESLSHWQMSGPPSRPAGSAPAR